MRNSLLPIILLVATTAFSLWLIRGGAERGAGGPDVVPGILRLPEKSGQQTSPATIDGATTVTGDAPADSATWRVVLIAGDDNRPLTNAAVLALGEEFTRRGCVAVLDPSTHQRQEPLPLGCDGILRIATSEGQPPTEHPGALQCALRVTATPVRLPADHPAARWLPDLPAASATTLTVAHHSTPVGMPTWPHWYAGIGTAIADAVLDRLHTPKEATDTAAHLRLTAWVLPGQAGPGSPTVPTNIYGRIPSPPQADIAEHVVAFQHPFVRGWIGDFSPVPVTARDQTERSAHDELLRRLVRGSWTPGPDLADAKTFSKDDKATDGSDIHRTISITATGFIEWQERPRPTALWQAWRDAAAAGDADAIAQLARHRTTAGIPTDLKP